MWPGREEEGVATEPLGGQGSEREAVAAATANGVGGARREREREPEEGMRARESAREVSGFRRPRGDEPSVALAREGQAGSCVPAHASAVRCFPSAFSQEEEDNWQGRWAVGCTATAG